MWSAAILAGGQATRMGGRDKSALRVGGRSILDRQLRELVQMTGDVMIVGGHPPPDAIGTTRLLADHVPGCGPLGGLHTALAEALGAAVVVVACDMPYITAPLLSHLLTLTCEADIVVPRTAAGYHPLCAAYTRSCVDAVAQAIGRRRLKLSALFDEVRVRVVTAEEVSAFGDPDRLLSNVNTAEEHAALESLRRHEL